MNRQVRFSLLLRLICSSAIVLLLTVGLWAQNQSLEETLQQLSADAAQQYVAPISSALGSNFNGAWMHKAPKAKTLGLDIEIGFVAMGSFFSTEDQHFAVDGQFTFSYNEAQQLVSGVTNATVKNELIAQLTTTPSQVKISGATVIGRSDDYITINFPGGTYQTSAGAVNLPAQDVVLPIAGFGEMAEVNLLPLLTPQLTIGTIMGTQFVLRYVPEVTLNAELGKLSYVGFGFQHNPFVWLASNPLPFDLAVGYFTQQAQVGDLFDLKASAWGVNSSKQFGFRFLNITPYAGFLMEKVTMDVKYQYIVQSPTGPLPQNIAFTLEGKNKMRYVVGLNLRFLIVNLNVDYNISEYNSFTAGLNVAF